MGFIQLGRSVTNEISTTLATKNLSAYDSMEENIGEMILFPGCLKTYPNNMTLWDWYQWRFSWLNQSEIFCGECSQVASKLWVLLLVGVPLIGILRYMYGMSWICIWYGSCLLFIRRQNDLNIHLVCSIALQICKDRVYPPVAGILWSSRQRLRFRVSVVHVIRLSKKALKQDRNTGRNLAELLKYPRDYLDHFYLLHTQNKKLVKVSQKVARNWSPCLSKKYWS